MPTKRDYHSATRNRAKAATRAAIIRALIDVILDDGVHAFTMQNVAARAHVALRTVYRHFPAREQLLEGLSDYLDDSMSALGFETPNTVEEMSAIAPMLYSNFAAIGDAMRASVIASIATGYRSQSHVSRWATIREALAAAYPALHVDELREASALIGTLVGSRTWYVLTSEQGLDPEQGGSAVEWGLRTLLADLARRNAAAIRTQPGRKHGSRKRDA